MNRDELKAIINSPTAPLLERRAAFRAFNRLLWHGETAEPVYVIEDYPLGEGEDELPTITTHRELVEAVKHARELIADYAENRAEIEAGDRPSLGAYIDAAVALGGFANGAFDGDVWALRTRLETVTLTIERAV